MRKLLKLIPWGVLLFPCILGYTTWCLTWWLLAMCTSSLINFIITALVVGLGVKVYTSYIGKVPEVNKDANVVIIGSGFAGI